MGAMNDVNRELALAQALEFELLLHTLAIEDAKEHGSDHVRRELILACFEVR
jgi:hypothetical protein